MNKKDEETIKKLLENVFFDSHFYHKHNNFLDWVPEEKDVKYLIDLAQSKIDKIPAARDDSKYADVADEIEACKPYLIAIKEMFEDSLKQITSSSKSCQEFEDQFNEYVTDYIDGYSQHEYYGIGKKTDHLYDAVIDYFLLYAGDFI